MTRQPHGTLAALISFALAVAASAFLLFVPMGSSKSAGTTVTAPPRAGSVSTSERTEDGRVVARETITYPAGRKEVRTYTRPAPEPDRRSLLDEQPKEILRVVAVALALTGLPLALNGTRFGRGRG